MCTDIRKRWREMVEFRLSMRILLLRFQICLLKLLYMCLLSPFLIKSAIRRAGQIGMHRSVHLSLDYKELVVGSPRASVAALLPVDSVHRCSQTILIAIITLITNYQQIVYWEYNLYHNFITIYLVMPGTIESKLGGMAF